MIGFIVRTFIVLLIPLLSWAQDHLLVNFTGQQIEDYVHLNFTVKGGIICTGTEVQRSNDSIHYETIGTIPGVCGNSISDQAYTFDDSAPLNNQFNFYRISMGQLGNSFAIKIAFADYGDGLRLSPNPATDLISIRFAGNGNTMFQFTLFNQNGTEVQEFQSKESSLVLSCGEIPSGLYFLMIRDHGKILFSERVVILR